tara:strand:+ start:1400 stop:1702 length:303 start_codon:yes stop_codon:yes gene_type:complete
MKPIDYPGNDNGLMVQYNRMREGPNYFMIYYKHRSVLRQDPKDAWRVLGSAKFTPNSQELKQWCLDMHDKYNHVEEDTRKDTSFASEVQKEPNDDTKMIV